MTTKLLNNSGLVTQLAVTPCFAAKEYGPFTWELCLSPQWLTSQCYFLKRTGQLRSLSYEYCRSKTHLIRKPHDSTVGPQCDVAFPLPCSWCLCKTLGCQMTTAPYVRGIFLHGYLFQRQLIKLVNLKATVNVNWPPFIEKLKGSQNRYAP